MNRTDKVSMNQTLTIVRGLKSLPRERAPKSLLPAVLRRVGLADTYWRLETSIGPVFVAHSRAGISMVTRARSGSEFARLFEKRFGRSIAADAGRPPRNVRAVAEGRLRGRDAGLRFDLRGLSEFEQAVLGKALEIPPGEVRPYSWIAREIGHPDAVRATGSALAKNPVPLLIPCHRVVRSDGHIGNYSMGGSRNKRVLLESEGAQPEMLERLAASGVRYFGNEKGRYFCFPTCGGIDSLMKENRVHFGSQQEALAAGYQPCGDCRPAAVAA
ncbi:MAG TPA: methylated-DNA--[protein]-cysteine S-methyltransferase [Thermoanaerobaculia bacterium]|jgi:O-6-methylguanine DNA methyltransferase|nr:methylated-DNA--[protein]-cysteine S-methyltransferase [Thermoanaerobaculia bacterium]